MARKKRTAADDIVAVLRRLRLRRGTKVPKHFWYSLTGRELWGTNPSKWGDSGNASKFLTSLTRRPDGTRGPLIQIRKRFYLREAVDVDVLADLDVLADADVFADADNEVAIVLRRLSLRRGSNIATHVWYSLTGRELWAGNRSKWGDSGNTRKFLESLTVNPDGTPGPLIQVGKRFYLRAKFHPLQLP